MVILTFTYVGIRCGEPVAFVRGSNENYILDLNGDALFYWGDSD